VTQVRLTAPDARSAAAWQTEVAALQQDDVILPNRMYRLYKPARAPDGHRVKLPCVGAQCSGRALIAWDDALAACATGQRIGVLDSDFDERHPAFEGRDITFRFFQPPGASRPGDSHGTSVLAILAGRPDSVTPGLIPDAQFFAAGAFYRSPEGEIVTDSASLAAALEWLSRNNVQIVNLSFTGPRDALIEAVIRTLASRGTIIVAAAGNNGPSGGPNYPAEYDVPAVVAVTAVDKDSKLYRYASRGAFIDFAAPGEGIWTATVEGKDRAVSGTSFAAPHVVAILATRDVAAAAFSEPGFMATLGVRDLGKPGRDEIFGEGLLLAPQQCVARMAGPVLSWPPMIATGSVQPGAQRVSSR
jgi:subtilisin family serine protease